MARLLTRRRQRADALVEFVLVVPILLLILFGVLEMGRVIDAWIVVQNAAREGARAGALANPATNASPAAKQAATAYLTTAFASRTDVDRTPAPIVVITADAVQVTAEADIHIYTPFMQFILASAVPVRGTTVMPR